MPEEKKITVSLKTIDKKLSYKFSPKLSTDNLSDHYFNLVNNFAAALNYLLGNLDILRPATQEERDAHIYVFRTDDKNDLEHRIYKVRKNLYDDLALLFRTILRQEFPDIEYLEECATYLQEFSFDNPDDKDYKEHVAHLTKDIRENYDKILAYVSRKGDIDGDEGQKTEE